MLAMTNREAACEGGTIHDAAAVATHPALAGVAIAPRLLAREQAAAYCSLSVQGFSQRVKSGRLPAPLVGTLRWDLRAIDAALDSMSGIANRSESGVDSSALDQWKAKHARTS